MTRYISHPGNGATCSVCTGVRWTEGGVNKSWYANVDGNSCRLGKFIGWEWSPGDPPISFGVWNYDSLSSIYVDEDTSIVLDSSDFTGWWGCSITPYGEVAACVFWLLSPYPSGSYNLYCEKYVDGSWVRTFEITASLTQGEASYLIVGSWNGIIDGVEICGDGTYRLGLENVSNSAYYMYEEFTITGAPATNDQDDFVSDCSLSHSGKLFMDLDSLNYKVVVIKGSPACAVQASPLWCKSTVYDYDGTNFTEIQTFNRYSYTGSSVDFTISTNDYHDKDECYWYYWQILHSFSCTLVQDFTVAGDLLTPLYIIKPAISLEKSIIDINESVRYGVDTGITNKYAFQQLTSKTLVIKNSLGTVVHTDYGVNPEVLYNWLPTAKGEYTIELQIEIGVYSDVSTTTFYVTGEVEVPEARFEVYTDDQEVYPITGQIPFTVTIENTGSNYDTCEWDYGDGETGTSTDAIHTHTYNEAGIYNISLIVTNTDGSDYCTLINAVVATVDPVGPPTADFTYTYKDYPMGTHSNNDTELNTDTAPLIIEFEDTTAEYTYYRLWTFGDGTSESGNSPSHRFNRPGSYDVTLYVENSEGSDSKTVTIDIPYFSISSQFAVNPEPNGFPPLLLTFTSLVKFEYNVSIRSADQTIVFDEDYIDPARILDYMPQGTIFYFTTSPGGYYYDSDKVIHYIDETYVFIVTGHETYPDRANIMVASKFAKTNEDIYRCPYGMSPSDFIIKGWSVIGSLDDAVISWNFGDDSEEETGNQVTHIYQDAGHFDVTCKVSIGEYISEYTVENLVSCGSVFPMFSITVTNGEGNSPHNVQFKANVMGEIAISKYVWCFGDNEFQTTTGDTVAHTYTSPGNYTVYCTAFIGTSSMKVLSIGQVVIS